MSARSGDREKSSGGGALGVAFLATLAGITALIAVIEVDDLEAGLASVEAAGGVIIRPIFAFPGGRRFHFREPSGNELAVYVNEPD